MKRDSHRFYFECCDRKCYVLLLLCTMWTPPCGLHQPRRFIYVQRDVKWRCVQCLDAEFHARWAVSGGGCYPTAGGGNSSTTFLSESLLQSMWFTLETSVNVYSNWDVKGAMWESRLITNFFSQNDWQGWEYCDLINYTVINTEKS